MQATAIYLYCTRNSVGCGNVLDDRITKLFREIYAGHLMPVQIRLPTFQPDEYHLPEQCPYKGCSGDTLKRHKLFFGQPKIDPSPILRNSILLAHFRIQAWFFSQISRV